MAEQTIPLMENLVSLCKRRGFIFPSSEIYGGFGGFWDYGPLGVALKRNVENLWWNFMVERRDNVVGLDSSIICHPRVWKASGHVDHFSDLMIDCKGCKRRFRDDQVEAGKCPFCGSLELTEPRQFNLMMQTYIGPVFDEEHRAYLRAETCQPIFVDFDSIRISSRQKLPFGIAQIGKAFRNEINPRNFTFRSREFSQMEMEFFVHPSEDMQWFEYWKSERTRYYRDALKFDMDKLRIHDHGPDELAHYAKCALEFQFEFPFGWQELEGVHHRGDYDLRQHSEYSEKDLVYFDDQTRERFYPVVIETSVGLDRTILALLCAAYDEDEAETKKEDKEVDRRVVMRFPAAVAPIQCGLLPLSKKLEEPAQAALQPLRERFRCDFDVTGSIGKRYRRQDEIGTPFCLTFDFDSLEDHSVTIRHRDTMEQERIPLDQIESELAARLAAF